MVLCPSMNSSTAKPKRPTLRHISHSFNNADHQASALRLIFSLFPEWEKDEGEIKLTRFTDGITNTLLKAAKHRPGWSESQVDADSILIRAYGRGTEVLIDREKETASHLLLASHNLAPPLLARFQNGMIYRFIPGRVCTPADLRKESVWRGVAARLGQWHASLPITPSMPAKVVENGHPAVPISFALQEPVPPSDLNGLTSKTVTPNVWTIMQKWIRALPAESESEKSRQALLQKELDRTVSEFVHLPGLGKDGLVLSHCDLLSGNVVIVSSPSKKSVDGTKESEDVNFIDYEYAVPAPAAFDLANHFAEWGGFDCDYSVLPTRGTRRAFLSVYLGSYKQNLENGKDLPAYADLDAVVESVDHFRGIPGLYWGIWALIQATISQIDFDYAEYAEIRLGEYFAWRAEEDGSRAKGGKEMPLREKRWAE